MGLTTMVIIGIAVLVLLFVGLKIMKSCLPKIIIGIIILGALAYVAYYYLFR